MPDRVKPRYYGMPVSPGRVAELAQEHGGLPERVGRHPALAGDRLAQLGRPGRRGTPGRVSEGPRMIPDGGIRACDRERTQIPTESGALVAASASQMSRHASRAATGEPGLRHAACHRTDHRFRVVGTRHPVAIGERVHEPAAALASLAESTRKRRSRTRRSAVRCWTARRCAACRADCVLFFLRSLPFPPTR